MNTRTLLSLVVGLVCFYPPNELHWVMAVASIAAFIVAFGIGANDVANSFGTSVGSGAISVRTALVIAGIMEFTGAVALGQSVAETIRSGISKSDCFADAEAILMLGMMCSLLSAGTWLLIASYFGLPVSTTHSTVGAIIGFTVAAKGWDCVHWGWLEGGKGFAGIALSWIVSPLASGIVAAIIYLLVVIIILKAPNPEKRAFQSIPFIFAGTVAIVTALIFLKSPALKKVKFPEEASWGIVGGLTGICFIVGFFWGTPIMKKFMYLRTKYTSPKSPQYDSLPDENIPLTEENAETEDRRAQESAVDNVFVFFQVMTASFESFAHGANDTANAIGPFVAVFLIYYYGEPVKEDTPVWALAAGGAGIVVGLATFGQRVMDTIGKDLTNVNFTRGFAIEMASTLVVVVASRLGFPISTTHCQVGSVVFVGWINKWLHQTRFSPAEPLDTVGVDWRLFLNVGISWVVTVPVAGIMSAGIYGILSHLVVDPHVVYPCGNITNITHSLL